MEDDESREQLMKEIGERWKKEREERDEEWIRRAERPAKIDGSKMSKRLRLGVIIGLIGVVLVYLYSFNIFTSMVIPMIALGSIAIAWKWELIGGILLIIIGVSHFWDVTLSSPFVLLLLVSGFVFILSWWGGRKATEWWVLGRISGIFGVVGYTAIAVNMFIRLSDYWFFLVIAPIFLFGVTLPRDLSGLAGGIQIFASLLAPFVLAVGGTVVEPENLGVLGIAFQALLICSPLFLVSGIIFIFSGGRRGKL